MFALRTISFTTITRSPKLGEGDPLAPLIINYPLYTTHIRYFRSFAPITLNPLELPMLLLETQPVPHALQ